MHEQFPNRRGVYDLFNDYSEQSCLMLFDTLKERANGLGEKYTFGPMNVGHCAVHQTMADRLMVEVNDIVYVKANMYYHFKALADLYNENVAIPKGQP